MPRHAGCLGYINGLVNQEGRLVAASAFATSLNSPALAGTVNDYGARGVT